MLDTSGLADKPGNTHGMMMLWKSSMQHDIARIMHVCVFRVFCYGVHGESVCQGTFESSRAPTMIGRQGVRGLTFGKAGA